MDPVPIKDFEGIYTINRKGEISSRYFKNKILKHVVDGQGYYMINLWKNKKPKSVRAHRILAKTFLPNPENKTYVNHIDGNKLNNDLSNLEWSTPSENMQHAYDTGLNKGPRGELSGHHKLTNSDIEFIRANKGVLTGMQLADKFSIRRKHVYKIQSRKAWSHV
jgi:hypothetical protein